MRRIWLCVLALTAISAVSALAQRYPFVPVPGAPHGIYQIFQDSKSGLWLGTIDDVVRFDGQHFYSLRQYGFPKEVSNGFAEDSDGGVWIATQGTDVAGGTRRGGLYRYQAGRVDKQFSGDVLSVVAIAPGLMLAAIGLEASGKPTYGDLVLFRKSSQGWTSTAILSSQADHLTLDHQGNLLFPCPGGWCEISAQQLQRLQNALSPLSVIRHPGNPRIERVLRDKFGCVWMRAEGSASYQCAADPEPVKLSADVSGYDASAHLEEALDGSIFMLVPMVLGRPGSFHPATRTEGLPEPIDTAIVGKDGTIWVGAETGLYRFMYPFRAVYWDRSAGIDVTSSIVLKGDRVISASNAIYELDPKTNDWRKTPNTENFHGVARDAPGSNAVYTELATAVTRFDLTGKILAMGTMPNFRDGSGSLVWTGGSETWFGTDTLYRILEAGKQLSFIPENVPKGSIGDIEYDKTRQILWACDGNQVIFRKDGPWGQITQKDGLLDLPCKAIGIEPDGDIWVGYNAKAVSWVHNPTSGRPAIRNYTQWLNDLTANNSVGFLKMDARGRWWWGTNGLYIANANSARQGNWIRLDQRDLAGPEVLPEERYGFETAPDGSIWLGTQVGVLHFSPPEDFATNFPAPNVYVAGFSGGGVPPTLADAIAEIPRAADLTAHIGMLQFDRRGAVQLRYRVLPDQPDWKLSNTFNLALGKLHWGKHRLQVQAQLATGAWSQVAQQTLEIPWPGWLTWPAWLLYGIGGTGIGFGARQWWRRREYERNLPLPDLRAWRLGALAPETEALIGTVVDERYEIGHILSVGGFATVARARDLKEDTLCAIKIFRFELGDRAWIRHRFEQEISALAKVKHPNIVRITGHGAIESGAPYLVMEFVHGRTLREYLEKGALERPQAGEFLDQLAGALAELHSAQIFHRDLKPENLMIRAGRDRAGAGEDSKPQIVLIDFSIAIVKAPDQTFHGISRVAGTLDYMAPEQVIGYADASTDIYSLAKVLLEMVTGVRWTEFLPEAKLDLPNQLRDFFHERPQMFGSESVEMIVSALAFDPGSRPKDVILFAAPIIRDLKHS